MDKPKVTPKDFFLWAGAMVALYWSLISFVTLIFEYINHSYPDPLEYYVDPFSGAIRFAMASLIVLVPLAVILMRFIRNDIAAEPSKEELWVRRWALVLTVFIAGVAVVGDLIALVNYFLGGDLTMRFVLKVAVLFLVAGGVFLHFLADLRGYWSMNPDKAKLVGIGVGILVLFSIAAGFFILGTPGEVRLKRYDMQKMQDLQNIQWQVVSYWQSKEKLPASLDETKDPLGGYQMPVDPQTGGSYVYRATGALAFELCATFNAEGGDQYSVRAPIPAGKEGASDTWDHGAGEVCFQRSIDPERYPTTKSLR